MDNGNDIAPEDRLDRFVIAQDDSFAKARDEIAAARKTSHWMWFVFPQLRGLGRSETAHFYGIADLDETARYLAHPVLGPRLVDVAELMLRHEGLSAQDILGPVDGVKLRSSMTLFSLVPDAPPVFGKVLAAYFDAPCGRTRERLGA